MKLRTIFTLVLVTLVTFTAVAPAYAATDQQDICEDAYGTWTGADAFNGECEYTFGTPTAEQACGENGKLITAFTNGNQISEHCGYRPTPVGTAGGETGNSNGAVTVSLGQGKNGSAVFSPDACPKKCTVSANLLRAAKNALPADALATLTVRIVGGSGGSYLVCFKTAGLSNPTIYRFAGGSWFSIATITSGNRLCASNTGTASFYLGAS